MGDVPENLRAIDLWIGEEGDLGRGYGTQMMHRALARGFAVPEVTAISIEPLASPTRAYRFYERQRVLTIMRGVAIQYVTYERGTLAAAVSQECPKKARLPRMLTPFPGEEAAVVRRR